MKTFDSINHEALWRTLIKFGCPPKYVAVLRPLYKNISMTVVSRESETDSFIVKTEVKQGCVIPPNLFSIFLAVILLVTEFLSRLNIQYRMEGKLFNLNCLLSKTQTIIKSVMELQHADNCALCTHSEEDFQKTVDILSEAYNQLSLSHHTKKTKVLHQQALNYQDPAPTIKINKGTLVNVEHFPCLCSYL